MKGAYAVRRSIAVLCLVLVIIFGVVNSPESYETTTSHEVDRQDVLITNEALGVLNELEVKGRAPRTNYSRAHFGDGWESIAGCDTRNEILRRDLKQTVINDKCQVVSGILQDPYTGKTIEFQRGSSSSQLVQIDHVVALSDAWQKGAQLLSYEERVRFANDPLELLAVDGTINQQKADSDAATWLPPNRSFRCQYVARQVAVKKKYKLWVTQAEKDAMSRVLQTCPNQKMPEGYTVSSMVY